MLGCNGASSNPLEFDAGMIDANVGPYDGPMIRQVLLNERVPDGSGGFEVRRQSAFGSPTVDPGDDGQVSQAVVEGNTVVVVLDRPLLASRFWEIRCEGVPRRFERIPDDATADDLARCTPPDLDECTAFCEGSGVELADGQPVLNMVEYGVNRRGVQIACDEVNIPIIGSGATFEPNGPRGLLVVQPPLAITVAALRTSAVCEVTFRDEIVDVDGARVCAPEGGDTSKSCSVPGAPVEFGTEALELVNSDPLDGEAMVSHTAPGSSAKDLYLDFNVPVASNAATSLSLMENGSPRAIDVMVPNSGTLLTITVPGGLIANASYVLTVDGTLSDRFGGQFQESATISFTSAP